MPTLHFVLQSSVTSVSGPFSATKRRGSRGLKAGQLGSVFVPLPLSVLPWQLICFFFFFFYFHPSNLGGRKGLRGGSGKSEGWQTRKRAPFFPHPFLHWKKCGVISCQGGGLSQEDTRAVEPTAAACVGHIQSTYILLSMNTERNCEDCYESSSLALISDQQRGLHVGEGPLSWSLMTIRRCGAFGDMWALQAWVALPHHTLGCNKYQHCNFTPVIIIASSITDRESSTHLL